MGTLEDFIDAFDFDEGMCLRFSIFAAFVGLWLYSGSFAAAVFLSPFVGGAICIALFAAWMGLWFCGLVIRALIGVFRLLKPYIQTPPPGGHTGGGAAIKRG